MENPNIGKIIKVGTSHAIVIPVSILRALKINRGDRVVFAVYDENIFAVRRLTQEELRGLKPGDVSF